MAPTEIISSACVRIVLHTIRFTLYGPCSESCGAIFLKTNYPWIRMITQFLKCTDERFHKKYGVFAPETSFIYFYFLNKFLLECSFGASHVALVVKSMPASAAGIKETQVQSLGQEAPLEKEVAAHSSILAWRISWTEEPGRLQSTGS